MKTSATRVKKPWQQVSQVHKAVILDTKTGAIRANTKSISCACERARAARYNQGPRQLLGRD
eukprot:1159039-Pelagomonas_calceolata.AAC.2